MNSFTIYTDTKNIESIKQVVHEYRLECEVLEPKDGISQINISDPTGGEISMNTAFQMGMMFNMLISD